jgi:DNA polymerase-3 subunit epsilon
MTQKTQKNAKVAKENDELTFALFADFCAFCVFSSVLQWTHPTHATASLKYHLEMFDSAVVFLDLETTGANADRDRVTEIGLIEVVDGEYVDEWSVLVNPGKPIPSGITTLTGITDDMVAAAPTFADIAPQLQRRLEGRLLIAHNARFDYQFLRAEFRRLNVLFTSSVLCTVRLSRRLFPEHRHHNLDSLMERFAISCSARHRALPDAQVIWSFARELKRRLDPQALRQAIEAVVQLPVQSRGQISELWQRVPSVPGVYVFYDADGSPLYVGKSANLRSRILADLEGQGSRLEHLRHLQEATLEWTETAGELGAGLREIDLLRTLQPRYNRKRLIGEAWTWDWSPAGVTLIELTHLTGADSEPRYGLFRNRNDAIAALRGVVRTHGLCAILTGLEPAPGPCTFQTAGTCRGACIGTERPVLHTARLISALARLRLAPWPFHGPIAVRESDPYRAMSEIHVVDRWRYLGSARTDPELAELLELRVLPDFDIDHYRLIERHLSQPQAARDVIDLQRNASQALEW